MEKIRSGQTFLYRENGLNSTVLDIRMKSKIRGDILQRALTQTLQRYPYMTSKLVEKNGDFYLEESQIQMNVQKTEALRTLGSASTGYHLIDVTYWDRKIFISFHHALCDGRGIKPFLETLVYYYCCLRYNKTLDSTGVRLLEEPLLPDETQEPVGNTQFEVDTNNLPQVNKTGYALPENAENCDSYYRHEIMIKQQDYIDFMKVHEATPAILLALLVSSSIQTAHPDADKPIVCSMAIDYRKEIGLENTHKNCVGSLYLPYSADTHALPISQQARLYRNLMKEQRTPDAIKNTVNTQIGLCEKLDTLPSLDAKRQALSFFNDMRIDTYVISYLGQMQLGGAEEFVESVHLYNSGVKGLRINMICAGDYFSIDILQNFQSQDFVNTFEKTLDACGIPYCVSKNILFETTKDKAYITASGQAERYYK
jgi:Uncharacterized protein containing a NRPS condensation (elongation) domain